MKLNKVHQLLINLLLTEELTTWQQKCFDYVNHPVYEGKTKHCTWSWTFQHKYDTFVYFFDVCQTS